MVVMTATPSIAVRVRRSGYDKRFKDLTIRSYNKGHKTEVDKLRAGHGDYYLYCWTDAAGRISSYWIIDLDTVREAGLLEKPTSRSNHDGTMFLTISRKELVVAGALLVDWKDGYDILAGQGYQMPLFV
jgi:hypothetical protein